MNAITIPKNLIRNDDLVIILAEYEEFLSYKLKIPKKSLLLLSKENYQQSETKELPKEYFYFK